MEWFEFDGIRSTDFNVAVVQIGSEKHNYFGAPSKDIVSQKIAGANGQRVFEKTYSSKTITLTCALIDNTDDILFRDLNAWLGRIGQHTLVLSRQQWKQYRNVTLSSEITTDNYGKGSIFQVQFTAYTPLAFSSFTTSEIGSIEYDMGYLYDSGLLYVDDGGSDYSWTGAELPNINIYNGGTTTGKDGASPVITVNGSGSNITIAKYRDSARTELETSMTYGTFSGELKFDCNRRNVFLNNNLNNSTFNGEYIKLDGRTTTSLNRRNFLVSGNKNSNEITLDVGASSSNDFYNGKYISIQNCDAQSFFRSKIVDYNGSTKIATLEDNLQFSVSNKEYAIYDSTDGVNYISITGTSLNISTVEVDFRYVYVG